MSDQRNGGISWADETWNVLRGCQLDNPDCINCYARQIAATRLASEGQAYHGLALMKTTGPQWTGKITLVEELLDRPLRWQRPRRIFTNAMSDLFYKELATADIDRIVAVQWLAWWHVFQNLTKRSARMAEYLNDPGTPARVYAAAVEIYAKLPKALQLKILRGAMWTVWGGLDYRLPREMPAAMTQAEDLAVQWPIKNIWWGVSMGHQAAADEKMPDVVRSRAHAAVLWVSAEPLWAPMTLRRWLAAGLKLDWLVTGGESGDGARPLHPAWARLSRDEAAEFGIAFHFKQWGEWMPDAMFDNVSRRGVMLKADGTKPTEAEAEFMFDPTFELSAWQHLTKVGKRVAGRLLDGVEYAAYPAVAATV